MTTRRRFLWGMLSLGLWGGLMIFPVLLAAETEKDSSSVSSIQDRDAYVQERDRLARLRRFSFNNDGCDAFYFPTDREVTPENLLDLRTTDLSETAVTTLTYCSLSSGFGHFTHNTQKGELLARNYDPSDTTVKNIASDMIAQGRDVLKIMVDFCHAHQMECFWSIRMNDTHDSGTTPTVWDPLFPQLKKDHPE